MAEPSSAERVVAGVDVGGTSIKGVLTARDGEPLARLERPTPVADGVAAVVEAVIETASRLLSAAPGSLPGGIGLVMPGVVDRVAGVARWSANIGWRDLPIRRLVAERLGVPVTIEHDVRAAALAEAQEGAARGRRGVLFVSIGTGLAGALVLGGAVVDGTRGMAGEIGHVPVVFPGGEPCACGGRGCAETYASGAAVSRRYAAATAGASVPAEVVVARARAGETSARAVLDDAIGALARMVLGAVLLADPEVVVLGGGMAAAGSALTEPLSAAIQRAAPWRSAPEVVVAGLGGDAGARGAALFAWATHDSTPVAVASRPPGPDRP